MQPLRILLIDDDAQVRRALASVMKPHDVTTAGSAGEARRALREGGFDFVLSDVHLPDGLGSDLLPWMQTEGLAVPPMVLMSGAVELVATEQRILRKPFISGPLLEILDGLSSGQNGVGWPETL